MAGVYIIIFFAIVLVIGIVKANYKINKNEDKLNK